MTVDTGRTAAELVEPLERSLAALRHETIVLGSRLSALFPDDARRRTSGAFRVYGEVVETQVAAALLVDAVTRCHDEALITYSPRYGEELIPARDIRSACSRLKRGSGVRVLCSNVGWACVPDDDFLRETLEEGGAVRAHTEVIDRFVLFDQEMLFIGPEDVEERDGRVVVVRDPLIVGFARRMFDQVWVTAIPVPGQRLVRDDDRDQIRISILRMLAQGYKDETISRRLDMALRTCRRHIAEICAALGASSRFQAGFAAAQMEELAGGRSQRQDRA